MRARFVLLLAPLTCLALACGPGNVAQPVRVELPPTPEATSAAACRGVEDNAAPLIVDWRQDERVEIETQMASGLAVVAYDCNGIRLLPDCHIKGRYGYTGTTKDEQVVQLNTTGEVSASLPKTGAALGREVSADLARGASIDLALVMVGRRRTKRAHAAAADLVGDCKGATHFIRGAAVGAFAMSAGSQGKLRPAAEIFGGGAGASGISGHVGLSTKGSIAKCDTTKPGDDVPPQGCDAIYRIELAAIGEPEAAAVASDTPAVSEPECPPEMVMTDGKCTKPSAVAPAKPSAVASNVCGDAAPAICEQECNRGVTYSCWTLGWNYEYGTTVPKDELRAHALYQKACDGGSAPGCRSLGWLYWTGKGKKRDSGRAARYSKLGCDRGDVYACTNLGYMVHKGDGAPLDLKRAVALYQKGCDGGDPQGCFNLGWMYENGEGVAKDEAHAGRLYSSACNKGYTKACSSYGDLLVTGRGVAADRQLGVDYFRRGCKGGNTWGCDRLRDLGETP